MLDSSVCFMECFPGLMDTGAASGSSAVDIQLCLPVPDLPAYTSEAILDLNHMTSFICVALYSLKQKESNKNLSGIVKLRA